MYGNLIWNNPAFGGSPSLPGGSLPPLYRQPPAHLAKVPGFRLGGGSGRVSPHVPWQPMTYSSSGYAPLPFGFGAQVAPAAARPRSRPLADSVRDRLFGGATPGLYNRITHPGTPPVYHPPVYRAEDYMPEIPVWEPPAVEDVVAPLEDWLAGNDPSGDEGYGFDPDIPSFASVMDAYNQENPIYGDDPAGPAPPTGNASMNPNDPVAIALGLAAGFSGGGPGGPGDPAEANATFGVDDNDPDAAPDPV